MNFCRVHNDKIAEAPMILLTAIIASGLAPLFMHRRHFIGQDVLVSAILDSKVHRRRAYQPAEQHSPKRGRDIAIGGEDGNVPVDRG